MRSGNRQLDLFMGSQLMYRMKESGEQYDDRIVEVHWDTARNGWRFMRIRDDKHDANHKSIMEKILISIEDGVEVEAVRCLPSSRFSLTG